MARLEMQEIYKVDGYGLIVHFNDGTAARFTVDELSNMRPIREPAKKVPEVTLQAPGFHPG